MSGTEVPYNSNFTRNDFEEVLKQIQEAKPQPYQMIIGIIQVIYDRFGKEGLKAWLNDPEYEFMAGHDAHVLIKKLLE